MIYMKSHVKYWILIFYKFFILLRLHIKKIEILICYFHLINQYYINNTMELENEIETLKTKLLELENKKQKEKEYNERSNINRNLDVIQKGINERTGKINGNRYSKSCIVTKFVDMEMIPQLQAIHNLFVTLNERIDNLEKNLSDMK
jgi:polyhydroxyalkanoate synthesis regulator phasin